MQEEGASYWVKAGNRNPIARQSPLSPDYSFLYFIIIVIIITLP